MYLVLFPICSSLIAFHCYLWSSLHVRSCGTGSEAWDRLQAALLEVEAAGTTETTGH